MVLVEALAALEDWTALHEFLPCGDRRSARVHLVHAVRSFEKFQVQYQATRTRRIMTALTTAQGGSAEAPLAARAEFSSRTAP